ncbi:MAG: YybH family protein [Planctomycetota bacterium]|jgi:ketosteroid isomerase-like protein
MKTMIFKAFFLFSAVTVLLICGCQTARTEPCRLTDIDRAAIEAVVQEFAGTTLSGDCSALARLFTEDAVQIPPDVPPVHSRQAIEDWCSEVDIEISDLVMPIGEIDGCRDTAWIRGSYQFEFMEVVKGSYVMTLKRQPERAWQVKTLIWTNLSKQTRGSGEG